MNCSFIAKRTHQGALCVRGEHSASLVALLLVLLGCASRSRAEKDYRQYIEVIVIANPQKIGIGNRNKQAWNGSTLNAGKS